MFYIALDMDGWVFVLNIKDTINEMVRRIGLFNDKKRWIKLPLILFGNISDLKINFNKTDM